MRGAARTPCSRRAGPRVSQISLSRAVSSVACTDAQPPPAAGAALTAGFEFDWPVRFDTDRLDITHELIGAGRAVSVPIIEIR